MKEEFGYVIEHCSSDPSTPLYWTGGDRWSYNSLDAIRFCREDDASRVACHLLPQPTLHRIAEHIWT